MICFPQQTHAKDATPTALFTDELLQPWKPVREVLDLNDEGESIFGRKKPLVESTLERIYAGLMKFVAGGKYAFLVKWNSMNRNGKYNPPGIDEPSPVVATQNRLGMAKVSFLSKQFGGHPDSKNVSLDAPAGAITTIDHHAFISVYYGNGFNRSVEELVACKPWIMNTNFKNVGSSIDQPSQVITANRKWHYLMNPQFYSKGGSIDNPCFTLIARMDKMPPYLMSAQTDGELPNFIVPTDEGLVYCIYAIRKLEHLYEWTHIAC